MVPRLTLVAFPLRDDIRFWGPEAFDKAKIAETEANYLRVKDKFKGRKCKQCGNTETSIAWSPVAPPDMAQNVGLGRFIFYAYTMPLLNAHPTVKGTLQRLEGEENGPIGFGDHVKPRTRGQSAFDGACAFALRALRAGRTVSCEWS